MGEAKVEVELENAEDRGLFLHGYIREEQIRSIKVPLLVNSGAVMLVLPQDLVETLGLSEVGKVIVPYAEKIDTSARVALSSTLQSKVKEWNNLARLRVVKERV